MYVINWQWESSTTPVLLNSYTLAIMFTNVWNTQWRNGHNCRCCLPNFRIRGDRQLKHQPKKNEESQQPIQTPLSIGLFLAIHSRVRDMTLSITLHNFTLGATTKESLINKWRMKSLNISQNPDCYIFVKVQMRKGKKLAKRCLLHWLRPPPPTHTHIIRPCIQVWC